MAGQNVFIFLSPLHKKKAQSNTCVFWGVVIQPLLCLEFRFYSFFFLSKRNPKFLRLTMKSIWEVVGVHCCFWVFSVASEWREPCTETFGLNSRTQTLCQQVVFSQSLSHSLQWNNHELTLLYLVPLQGKDLHPRFSHSSCFTKQIPD